MVSTSPSPTRPQARISALSFCKSAMFPSSSKKEKLHGRYGNRPGRGPPRSSGPLRGWNHPCLGGHLPPPILPPGERGGDGRLSGLGEVEPGRESSRSRAASTARGPVRLTRLPRRPDEGAGHRTGPRRGLVGLQASPDLLSVDLNVGRRRDPEPDPLPADFEDGDDELALGYPDHFTRLAA